MGNLSRSGWRAGANLLSVNENEDEGMDLGAGGRSQGEREDGGGVAITEMHVVGHSCPSEVLRITTSSPRWRAQLSLCRVCGGVVRVSASV